MKYSKSGRRLKICRTMHYFSLNPTHVRKQSVDTNTFLLQLKYIFLFNIKDLFSEPCEKAVKKLTSKKTSLFLLTTFNTFFLEVKLSSKHLSIIKYFSLHLTYVRRQSVVI